jgi:3-dehydroquinate synthase
MVVLPVGETLTIRSYKGEYRVSFDIDRPDLVSRNANEVMHFLIDSKVAQLHATLLDPALAGGQAILIEATEENKSIEQIIHVMHQLAERRLRRQHRLVAVGGGIVQDITCFIASTMLRGVDWQFFPTTLLAQADSCIGSKSSVNLGNIKNALGTFYPPTEVFLCPGFLDTLQERELRSGIGEIIKVHAIDSPEAFDRLAADYDRLLNHRPTLCKYVEQALRIKQRYIEVDEFDRGIRNIFNYGHSFGHAIESASDFGIPHGIAVTMGMDIANNVAVQRGLLAGPHYARMHQLLRRNHQGFDAASIPFERAMQALERDKKNTSTQLVLILPVGEEARVQKVAVDNDATFARQFRTAVRALDS